MARKPKDNQRQSRPSRTDARGAKRAPVRTGHAPSSGAGAYRAIHGGRYEAPARSARNGGTQRYGAPSGAGMPRVSSSAGGAGFASGARGQSAPTRGNMASVSVGELRRSERNERAQKRARNYAIRIIAVLVLLAALALAGGIAYNSNLFAIENVDVRGVDHLTESEMSQLAAVPSDTTLLRVDTDTIKKRLLQNAWVKDVSIERAFPNTLVINVTERTIAAVVAVPQSNGKSTKRWAISSDHMWLMPIPEKDSESGKNTSEKIYEDVDAALKITNVPYGTQASIGSYCTDSNVLNALDIVSGMTTELASEVVEVSAAGADETTLMLDNGVEIAFGKAENIRDKERVVLQILKEHEGSVSYINVRTVASPTWRTV